MDINLLNICKEILESTENKLDVKCELFFNTSDDYKLYCIELLKQKMQQNLNNKKTQLKTITNIQKVYSYDNNGTIDNLSLLEYGNQIHKGIHLLKGDLIEINNNYFVITNINTDSHIEVQHIIYTKISIGDKICKLLNLKKYNRIYNSIDICNKYILRNLLNPNLHLTKLLKTKMKSDFWNDGQKNAIYNITKNTENKKIHLIDGVAKTGKTTLLLGLLQNINSRFENMKFLIINGNRNLNKFVNKIKIQQDILFPNKWFMIIGDNNFLDKQLHEYTITNYVNQYKYTMNNIDNYVQKMEKSVNEKDLLFSKLFNFIENVINNLPVEPFSHNNVTITEMLFEYKDDYANCVNQLQFILNKWKYGQYVNNVLIEKCNIIISTICSSGCLCFEVYKPDIIIIDDCEKLTELDILIPIKEVTQKLILSYNSNNINQKSFVNRLMMGGCNVHKLNEKFN